MLLVTQRHFSFIYSSGNSNINSIITLVRITGQAAQMIKHQEEHSSVINLEYVSRYMHCENYQRFFLFSLEANCSVLEVSTAFFPIDQGDSSLTTSEASAQDAMDNDDNWLRRFSTLTHNHKNVSFA